jgi:hypothetical protein
MGNGGCKKWSEETTQEAFEMLLERHFDLKNHFQLCQDLEIIRRVVFSQRHMVLSPLISLEAEKRAVDLLNKDLDFVQKLETGIPKVIRGVETKREDINEFEDVPPVCDGHDRIFKEQSSICMMFHQKMKVSGQESTMRFQKVHKSPPKKFEKRNKKFTKIAFGGEKFDFPFNSMLDSHLPYPERCDLDCKHRFNDCKALIDSLNKELSYEKSQRLKMEQR